LRREPQSGDTSTVQSLLNTTPRNVMVDARGRPYFLWDVDMTLQHFEERLRAGDRTTRACLVAKLMRQAKPDDVFTFVTLDQIRDLWPYLQRDLGLTRAFWEWLLRTLKVVA
jgi:hypothetical protein